MHLSLSHLAISINKPPQQGGLRHAPPAHQGRKEDANADSVSLGAQDPWDFCPVSQLVVASKFTKIRFAR